MIRLWDRLQVRKAEETLTVVNRHTRGAEIQPNLVERATGTRSPVPPSPRATRTCNRPWTPGGCRTWTPSPRSSRRCGPWRANSAWSTRRWPTAATAGRTAAATPGSRTARCRAAAAPRDSGGPGGERRGPRRGRHGGRHGHRARVADRGPLPSTGRFLRKRGGGDRGQVAVEFLGVLPLILVVLAVIWQCVLVGYTYSLAGDAADKGRAPGPGPRRARGLRRRRERGPAERVAGAADISCATEGSLTKATVKLRVPVLFPGSVDFPLTVTGSAGRWRRRGVRRWR
ncbi:TadE family protein [Streptomyces sp. M19]